ncbi:hypothetical protein WBP07_17820 [Novosphingobium sp. BL-8A]|uniref:hypothetical protein n=1 Tax=Novosphingobium sp. BL-8A TaxID=3127639 RepID=UPI0037568075
MTAAFAWLLAKATGAGLWLLDIAKRYPWQFALVAALALAWWQWSGKRDALAERDTARTTLASDRAEWNRNVAAAKAATAAAEQKSQEIAHDAQESHDALLADNAGLRDYIAAHRVRSETGSAPTSSSTAQDNGSAVPVEPATGSLVAVTEADLGVCDADYAYARSAYEWAQGLISKDLAVPQ